MPPRDEVRLDEIDCKRLAERVSLVLAKNPVATVVDEEQLRAQMVLPRAGELRDVVEKATVPGDREDRRVWQGCLRSQRRRPRISERSRSERVEEAARRQRGKVRARPVREDRHVPRVDCVARECLPDRFEETALQLAALLVETAADPVSYLRGGPLGPTVRLSDGKPLEDGAENRLRIADEAECRIGAADPLRCGVDLDDLPTGAQGILASRLRAELGPDAHEDVGTLDELLERSFVRRRARCERVIFGEGSLAHVGRRDRSLDSLSQGGQLGPGAGAADAASGPQDRALGRRNHTHRLLKARDRARRRLPVELVHGLYASLARQHVYRNLHEDRAAGRRERLAPRLS